MLPVWPVSGRFGHWRISVEDIKIGAYGEGDRPVLSGNRTITLMEDRNVVRDIHMSTIRFGGFGIPDRETAIDCILFNCVLDGTSENVALGRNMTIIGCEVYGNRVNGIFLQQRDWETYSNLEVGYNYIHTINQLWFGDGTPEGRIGQTPPGAIPSISRQCSMAIFGSITTFWTGRIPETSSTLSQMLPPTMPHRSRGFSRIISATAP